ncbi:Hexokinase [Pyrenophora tritici-repentis]|nr:Hexokinase [Pyrenophora tritici-repentis]
MAPPPSATHSINSESHTSTHQRSELSKMTNLPPSLEQALSHLDQQFWISCPKLKEIVHRFREELEQGLARDGQNIPMNISWVHALPSGREKGTILTLDLGGTNLRVCKVTLLGDSDEQQGSDTQKSVLEQEQYKLPASLKTGSAENLWTFIAEKVAAFIKSRGLDKQYNMQKRMPLGFTFSYPATQHRIDHAILQTWTKGFDIQGVEGQDVAAQLREKLAEKELPVQLICVINDTVGAMVASAYNDPDTIVGAIFGTGCNAAYLAHVSSIGKLDPDDERITAASAHNGASKGEEMMAVNCEYGAFDNAHRVLPRTPYDERIDAESPRPGEQTFEKLSAGLYLGEIFRLVLVDLVDKGLVLQAQSEDDGLKKLYTAYTIDTSFLSQIEDDQSPLFADTRELFAKTLALEPSDVDLEVSRRIAEMVAVRGARLCACGIAAICGKEGIEGGNVAADGSVANKHPKFKKRWARALGEVLDWEDGDGEKGPIRITSAEDGSGVGCAIIAAMELERRGEM